MLRCAEPPIPPSISVRSDSPLTTSRKYHLQILYLLWLNKRDARTFEEALCALPACEDDLAHKKRSFDDETSHAIHTLELMSMQDTHLCAMIAKLIETSTEKKRCDRELSCAYNYIQRVPSLKFFQHLKSIDFSHNMLSVFPCELFELLSLTSLRIKGNRIREIPTEIANLLRLKKLDVSCNAIDDLPPCLATMQLTDIDASTNEIRRFPDIPPALEILRLKGNKITVIPTRSISYQNECAIRILDLSNNLLSRIPFKLLRLAQIKWQSGQPNGKTVELDFSNNCVTDPELKKIVDDIRGIVYDIMNPHDTRRTLEKKQKELADFFRRVKELCDA